ncbi:MAG TPA: adenine phosphoribosyltransferase [Candidatus Lumbricidophila sp.]|nr:adenine phosphoribosyltransferase [Candidatus Lumbricidophila sp.]
MSELTPTALVESRIAVIPDFPTPGIVFRDLTPVFADGEALRALAAELTAPFEGQFDVLAGLEARGFLLAAAASMLCGVGVLPVRKAGKLPRAVYRQDYALEYGVAALEVHVDEVPQGTRVLIVDDVLATGGTVGAASALIERAGWHVAGVSVALELEALAGRAALPGREIFSLLKY